MLKKWVKPPLGVFFQIDDWLSVRRQSLLEQQQKIKNRKKTDNSNKQHDKSSSQQHRLTVTIIKTYHPTQQHPNNTIMMTTCRCILTKHIISKLQPKTLPAAAVAAVTYYKEFSALVSIEEEFPGYVSIIILHQRTMM